MNWRGLGSVLSSATWDTFRSAYEVKSSTIGSIYSVDGSNFPRLHIKHGPDSDLIHISPVVAGALINLVFRQPIGDLKTLRQITSSKILCKMPSVLCTLIPQQVSPFASLLFSTLVLVHVPRALNRIVPIDILVKLDGISCSSFLPVQF